MLRPQAAEILKEMLLHCKDLEGKSVKLMPADADSVLSKGWQIHVQKTSGADQCLRRIAEKHKLAIHEEENYLIIYRPTSNPPG